MNHIHAVPWKMLLKVTDSEKAWSYQVGTLVETYKMTPVRVELRKYMNKLEDKLPAKVQLGLG